MQYRFWVWALIGVGHVSGSCVPTSPSSQSAEKNKADQMIPQAQIASNVIETKSNGGFFEAIFNIPYETRLSELPTRASVNPPPKSGYWYPNSYGGTHVDVIGNRSSPLQKYDQAFYNGVKKAVAWEEANHDLIPNLPKEEQSWFGHCNGYAAATQRHEEPKKSVVRNGVEFHPKEIKALLAEIYMSADYRFLGGTRCESLDPNEGNRTSPTVLDSCQDTNAASFHLSLANWIGRANHLLIFDRHKIHEVWNFPLYEFSSTITEIDRAGANAFLNRQGTQYPFNPAAVSFRKVRTEIVFADGTPNETLGVLYPGKITYEYILELDGEGRVIGGEWRRSNHPESHPDFIWVALEPIDRIDHKDYGNPYLDRRTVLEMWAESVGKELDDTDPGLTRVDVPVEPWGKGNLFSLQLDSSQSGVAFLGKPIELKIERKEGLRDLSVRVILSEEIVVTQAAPGVDPVIIGLEPRHGINQLEVKWFRPPAPGSNQGQEVDSLKTYFHGFM